MSSSGGRRQSEAPAEPSNFRSGPARQCANHPRPSARQLIGISTGAESLS